MDISLMTKSEIVDYLVLSERPFHGNLDILSFLERVWNLSLMKARDSRHSSAYGDIRTHVVQFNDWSYGDLLYDYLKILECDDEKFLLFLETCLHPLVVSDDKQIDEMLTFFNAKLAQGGYQIKAVAHRLGRPLFKAEKMTVISEPAKQSVSVTTPSPIGRTKVFICYSHKDKRHLTRLQVHFAYYARNGLVDVWDDTKLLPGAVWHEEIKNAIMCTKVAILLVSADFLASKFIAENELPPLLAAAQMEGAVILPVILSACPYEDTELAKFQAVNSLSKPLIGMSKHEKERTWNEVVRVTKEIMTQASSLENSSKPSMPIGLFQNMPSIRPVSTPQPFKPGQRIRHSAYGVGVVLKTKMSPEGEINEVEFQLRDRIIRIWLNRHTGNAIQQYKPGDKVCHDMFGEGIILKSEMDRGTEFVEVQFTGQHGKKRLSMDFAKLEKLYGASNKLVEEVRQEEPLLTLQLRETIPPYVSGLNSTNPSIFLNSFSQALQYQDVKNVELHTHIQHFVATCDENVILPSSSGQREYGWKDIRKLMLADKIEFDFPQYTQRNPPLSGACANLPDTGNFYVLGTVDNKGFVLPISHFVGAVFVFTCVTCGSESTWAWKSVYICG